MIKAILLDLDDTLLKNPDTAIVAQYLEHADEYFFQRWGYEKISDVLIEVVGALTSQRDATASNSELAEIIIAAAVKRPLAEIRRGFDEFYQAIYPLLRPCVEPVPLASKLLETLRQSDYALVIATNPVYPATAIYQRLEWAGLPARPDDYALVTTADNMHFAKPDPAYYAEIIARVGVEPDETLMVGDNLENDIYPAARLGLNTFYVTQNNSQTDPDSSGTLADFYQKITQTTWPQQSQPPRLSPNAIEPQLLGNLGALFGLLALVKPQHWTQHPDPKEWSIMEILCHLYESERSVQRPRLERILAEDDPFLTPPKAPPGPNDSLPCAENGYEAAELFCQERHITIGMLRHLPASSWARPARHSIFGLTSFLEMAHFTAQHDRLHVRQLCETLGRCQE